MSFSTHTMLFVHGILWDKLIIKSHGGGKGAGVRKRGAKWPPKRGEGRGAIDNVSFRPSMVGGSS